jgi:cyclopropane-fatty-acyl-phospholipid synthase
LQFKIRQREKEMRVAVVGGEISGLVSAYVLLKARINVVLYEKEAYLGGHAKTINAAGVDLALTSL